MSLYKRSFARGINDELIRHGAVRFSTKEAADAVADAVGDAMPVEPSVAPVPPETAGEVAATLIDAANTLVSETGAAGMAPEGAPAMPEEEALKTSAAQDVDTRADVQARAIIQKVAAEKNAMAGMGSTIAGGDKGNTLADSAATTGEGGLEANRRPDMYANVGVQGVGDTGTGIGRGTGVVGDETVPASDPPSETPGGNNTVITQSKMGSNLREIIRKVAMAGMGSTIAGGDKGNKLPEAGSQTGEAELEAARRPEGYAHQGVRAVGTTETPIGRDQAASVGLEMPHPDQPGESPAGAVPGSAGNTVVEQSNASKKAEAENPFITLFKKTAEEVGAHIPAALTEEAKIAHVRQMIGMTESERDAYIGMLHKEAGASDDEAVAAAEKHASSCASRRQRRHNGNPNRQDRTKTNQKTAMSDAQEKLPEALKNAIKAKGDDEDKKPEDDKKEDKSDDKKPEDDKQEDMSYKESADLLSRIRNISQSVGA